MSTAPPIQVLATCERCRIEGAVIEVVDPAASRVLESHCRMCERSVVDGREERAGLPLLHADDVRRAFAAWSAREGEPHLGTFVAANFGDVSLGELIESVLARRSIPTSFDAVAWLFGGGMPAGIVDFEPSRDTNPDGDIGERVRQIEQRERSAQIAARALISVMVGDGTVRPEERAFVDQCLHYFGYPPMRDEDLRHWLPHDLGRPEHPFPLIEAMARLAFIDRQRDESEWRIVREFARAWGYPMTALDKLEADLAREYAPEAWRFWTSLRSFFVSERGKS